jgi:hypothetical protein
VAASQEGLAPRRWCQDYVAAIARILVNVEHMVELELAGETGVLAVDPHTNITGSLQVPYMTLPGIEPGPT